ncbi:hypothetical protein EGW08_019264 [Elysia chlorotica]|uniref:Alpha/beta hydrolase fold-5 domain-containing protein n=1 Tax=Elysia chlorotica TaxID=188477 RepID=A0A3S1B0A6_ELYCH|nr:hypothetical protein EGW08_019264 [Elysia chlorotica]
MIPFEQILVLLSTSFLVASAKVSSEIIQPIRSSGDEVALIFVPGAYQKAEYYSEIAGVIQETSQLRVWVALTGGYDSDYPNPRELPGAIDDAVSGLKQAGMVSDFYVGVGHGRGGIVLGTYARDSGLKALILMGCILNDTLSDFPVPVLTLASELDGLVRVTLVVDYFEQLLDSVSQSKDAIYRTPVINIQGTNHIQFETRPPLPRAVTRDIKSDVSDTEARKIISRHVNSFITATFRSVAGDVEVSRVELENDFIESDKRFKPILDMKALQVEGDSFPWASIAQRYFAGEFDNIVEVNNTLYGDIEEFIKFKPPIRYDVASGRFEVHTSAFIEYEGDYQTNQRVEKSPAEIRLKLKSKGAIHSARGAAPVEEWSCRSLNELALEYALNSSTSHARDRYHSRGRPMVFEDDIVATSGQEWLSTPLTIWRDADGLHVQAVALLAAVDSPMYGGMHYCCVMAPSQALEWIIIDSLRDY